MTARPAPYPADTKAKGWRFELDLEQVRQSDTWALATPATRPWLLMLWATAWEQAPCGSLPNDDALIAARIGMDAKAFAKVRDVLMRGWWLADDGRLYHDTISARVLAMIAKKDKDRQRKAGWRARQSGGQDDASHVSPASVPRDNHGTDSGRTPESDRKDDTKHQAPVVNTSPPLSRVSLADCDVSQMTPDWSPSDGFRATAKLAGIPFADEAFMASGLAEFRSYWLTRPGDVKTQAEWEHALLKSLKHALLNTKQPPAKAARKTSHTGFENIDYTAGVLPDGRLA